MRRSGRTGLVDGQGSSGQKYPRSVGPVGTTAQLAGRTRSAIELQAVLDQICGAECSSLSSHWSVGSPTISTLQKRSGTSSIRINATGPTDAFDYVFMPEATNARVVTRFSIYFTTLPTADALLWATKTNDNPSDVHLGFDAASGKFAIWYAVADRQVGTVTAALNTWYTFDIYVDATIAGPTTQWRIDGVAQTTKTGSSPAGIWNRGVYVGQSFDPTGVTPTNFVAYYDDILIAFDASRYPIADGFAQGPSPETWVFQVAGATNTILPTAIASAEAFGSFALIPGAVTISPTAITSAEAFGSFALKPTNTIAPTAISSGEVFGLPVVVPGAVTISPTAIGSGEAFGSFALKPTNAILPTAIGSGEAFGATVLTQSRTIAPTAIPSAEAFGAVILQPGNANILVTGIGSAEALGAVALYAIAYIRPSAIDASGVAGDGPAATPDAYLDAWRLKFVGNSPANTRFTPAGIGSGTGLGGNHSPIGVFDKHGLYAIEGAECGWYQNTSGSTQTIRARNSFGFSGYTMGLWAIVSAVAPSAITATPAASAAAAGATQLAIGSGAANSGAATISVPDGSYVYIAQIDVDIAWAGSSHQFIALETTGGTFLKMVGYFPSPGAGHPVDSWQSDFFITGGTKYPPGGVYGEGALGASNFWGQYQHLRIPNNYYFYVVAASYDITWAGASDEDIDLRDNAGTNRGGYVAGWPSQGSGHFSGEWDSAFFIIGGTNARPDTKWSNDGDTLNGAAAVVLNPAASPIGTGVGHGQGWYQNTTGGDLDISPRNNFINAGYSMAAWIVITADDPSTISLGAPPLGSPRVQRDISPTAIPSAEALGAPTLLSTTPQIIAPTAIASAEALGAVVLIPGNVNIQPTGIASQEAFGAVVVRAGNVNIAPTAIASQEAFGAVTLRATATISPTAIGSGEAVGLPTLVAGNVNIVPTAIPSQEVFGAVVLKATATISPTAIASAEAVGVPTLVAVATILPSAIPSAEAVGTPTLTVVLGQAILPSAIGSAEAVGNPTLVATATILPVGIASQETLGAVTVVHGAVVINPTGIPTAEVFGTTTLAAGGVIISPAGIVTAEAVGAPSLIASAVVIPSAIASGEVVGTPVLTATATILPVAISSQEAVGNAIISVGSASILPSGIPSAESFGNFTLLATAKILPTAVPSGEALGAATVVAGNVNIVPTGIPTGEGLGIPALAGAAGVIRPIAIDTAEFVGTPSLRLSTLSVSAIPSAEALGVPALLSTARILPAAIASAEAFGAVVLKAVSSIIPTGISSAEVVGTPVVLPTNTNIQPVGITSGEASGSQTVLPGAVTISPTSIASQEALGTPALVKGTALILPGGVPSGEVLGTPSLLTAGSFLLVNGIPTQEVVGLPALLGLARIIPETIGPAEALGLPKFTTLQFIRPGSIFSAEVVGIPGFAQLLAGWEWVNPTSAFAGTKQRGFPEQQDGEAHTKERGFPELQDNFAHSKRNEGSK